MENYLERCIKSILNQTYKNLEIFLINDGSSDNSSNIINFYKEKDPRIIPIHKKNEGIGSVCKMGIEKATGGYISFVDSDDYIKPNMYKDIIQVVNKKNFDIIQFNMIKVDETGLEKKLEQFGNFEFYNQEALFKDYYNKRFHPSLACRVFKKNVLNKTKLLNQNIGIDELLISQTFLKCTSLISLNKAYYYQFVRTSSVSRSIVDKKIIIQGIKVYHLILEIIKNSNP